MERADGVTGILVQVLACAGGYILVCKDLQVNRVYLWSVRVTTRIRFMQAVQGVWVIVCVTYPMEVLLIVLKVGRQVVIRNAGGGEAGPVGVARGADAVEGKGQFEI